MDDPTVKTPLTPIVPPDDQSNSVPQATIDPSPQPSAPMAPKIKEQAPVGGAAVGEKVGGIDVAEANRVAKEEGDQYWENYAKEIELEKEILEIGGVEKVESGEVKVPEKVAAEMGIKPTVNIQTPMANVTDFSIKGTSLTDDQLTMGITKPTSTGLRWLVEWFIYQLLKAHFHIKRLSGRILRSKSPA